MTEVWEVKPGEVTSEFVRGLVVRQSGFLGGVECSQPEPGPILWESDLGHPLPPVPLPHPSIKLRGLQRHAHVLHGDGFGPEEVEGVGILLVLGLGLDLSLDLRDLRGG